MTTAPFVELSFNPTDLRPQDLLTAGAFLGSPADALEAALSITRAAMVDQMRDEIRGIAAPTHAQLLRTADLAWQLAFWRFRKVSAPIIADAYIRAYRRAGAGEVPMSLIYDLADKHTEKIGWYFHETSREALAEGFNSMVNRQVSAKAAADVVLDAYGLTPRQMRGYTRVSQFKTPVSDVLPRPVKAKMREYIDRSFTSRVQNLTAQEEHNIDQQAQQFAWMWLQDQGQLSEKAQKLWITAKDERVCKVCGPLHGKKVRVNQQFKTPQGDFWTPGLHPNCRCVVRLLEMRFSKMLGGADLREFNELHPRAHDGRFGVKARTRPVKTIDVDQEFTRIITAQPKVDTKTEEEFSRIIAAQPTHAPTFTPVFRAATVAPAVTMAPVQMRAAVEQTMTQIAPPQMRLDFATDLVLDMRAMTQTQAPVATRTKPPTTKLDSPAWAVLTRDELADGRIDKLDLNKGIEFTTDEIGASLAAEQEVRDRIQGEVERITRDYGRQLTITDNQDEHTYYANVEQEDLNTVLSWAASNATRHKEPDYDPDWTGDGTVPITWTNAQGDKWWTERVPYSTIAHKFGVDQENLEVYLAMTRESHFGEEHVEDISGGSNSKHRSYGMDGWFDMVEGSEQRVSHGTYGVFAFEITPSGIHEEPEGE